MRDKGHIRKTSLDGIVRKKRFGGEVAKNGATDGKKETSDEHHAAGEKRQRSW